MVLDQLTVLLLLVFAAVAIVPALSRRLGIPVIVAEILVGILVGASWLDLVPENALVSFFSDFGLVYIMFLAGLEIDFDTIQEHLGRTVSIGVVSIGAGFAAGVLVAPWTGIHPLLMGSIFSTTSMSLVFPLTRELDIDGGVVETLLGSVALVDILSILVLGFSLGAIQGSSGSHFFYALAALLTLFFLPRVARASGVRSRVHAWLFEEPRHFEDAVRFSFALVFLLAAVTGELGFHGITGAFIAGLVISELAPGASDIGERLESFGYGFFIPLFFVIMGSQVDLPALFSHLANVKLFLAMVLVAMTVKIVSVALAARWQGLTSDESVAFGFFHSARVSLIIAAVEIGRSAGLITEPFFSMFILLAVISALVGPAVGKVALTRGMPWWNPTVETRTPTVGEPGSARESHGE